MPFPQSRELISTAFLFISWWVAWKPDYLSAISLRFQMMELAVLFDATDGHVGSELLTVENIGHSYAGDHLYYKKCSWPEHSIHRTTMPCGSEQTKSTFCCPLSTDQQRLLNLSHCYWRICIISTGSSGFMWDIVYHRIFEVKHALQRQKTVFWWA